MKHWYELRFWTDGAWDMADWRLKQEDDNFCPGRGCLWLSMELTPLEDVRVIIMGQDPYPNPALAMGLFASVPNLVRQAIPPTLRTIFDEYVNDLHLPRPTTTDLSPWAKQGVFLWNAYPTCKPWESMSHEWKEWERLTREIVDTLDERECVFVFMGAKARQYASCISSRDRAIETSHPSPRGCASGSNAFRGSRVFTRINDLLGTNPIDWRLP